MMRSILDTVFFASAIGVTWSGLVLTTTMFLDIYGVSSASIATIGLWAGIGTVAFSGVSLTTLILLGFLDT